MLPTAAQLFLLAVLWLSCSSQYKNYTLPDVPYKGPLMSKKLADVDRSQLVIKTVTEPLLKHSRAVALVLLAEDRSKRTSNSSVTSVIGYFPYNDQEYVFLFYNKMRILGYLAMRSESLDIKTNKTRLEYLEKHYLKRSQKLFKNNLAKSVNSSNRIEALGHQIYATYPGTRHCQAGRLVHYNGERAPLYDLEKCCVLRNRCDLQSNAMYKNIPTPTAADNFRRVSCECDEAFNRCLHAVSSSDADYMGELLYNVLELQCLQATCNGVATQTHSKCINGHYAIHWRTEVKPYTPSAKT